MDFETDCTVTNVRYPSGSKKKAATSHRTPKHAELDRAVVLEIEELELHQKRVEILDAYNSMKLVALIEVLSPTKKRSGPGKQSYQAKQQEILERDCHLVEIDLLRSGERVLSIPAWRLEQLSAFHYIACVNRWPRRNRFEVYPRLLPERLPRIAIPLTQPDVDVPLDLQAALETVYVEGRYQRRLRYDEPCEPALDDELQRWAKKPKRGRTPASSASLNKTSIQY